MKNTFIGTPMERREDLRFLRGRGEYVDDVQMPGVVYAVMLRNAVGHGRIVGIDITEALGMPGIHAILTAEDLPGGSVIIPTRVMPLPEFKPFEQPVLAREKVRYVGEPIAMVLADSIALGEDALSAINVDIEQLPPVADWTDAQENSSLLFESAKTNKSLVFEATKGDADAAFARAPYIRKERLKTGRHYCNTMETRGVMAVWDDEAERLRVYGAAKVPFFNRRILSGLINIHVDQIDLIENDVGGAFGTRGEFYPEDFLVPYAAKLLKRPVKFIEDRRESLMAMNHAREQEAVLEVACERDGTIIAIRGDVHIDMGAYMRTNGAVCARNSAQFISGPYRVAHVKVNSHLWLTNKTPVGTYRGPGRFEPSFFLERMVDMIADDLSVDRIEMRRKNLVRAEDQPFPIASVQPTNAKDQFDSGDYRVALDRVLTEIRWPEIANLQGRKIDGKYHGLGVICFVEGGAGGPKETARFEIDDDGRFSLYVGSSSVGQGIETVFAQIAADALEISVERVSGVYHGSTNLVSEGFGSSHSRSTVMAGSAILDAAVKFKTLIRQTAAADLRCSPEEVAIETDRLTGPKSSVPLSKYAGLTCEGVFLNTRHTWAYGAHAAHVRVDPRTGHIEILDYVVVEDVGRIVNPLTMSGQVIGSLVQGLGGTLLEELKYDENAQLLTGSLADYLLPTATDFPNLRSVLLEEAPSPINPLGAKGAGEGGTIGAGGCIANAVANALQTFGVQPRSLPLSPNAVWEMIQAAPASQIKKPGELSVASVL